MQKHELVKSYNFFGHAVYSPLAALMDTGSPLRDFLEKRLRDVLEFFDYDFSRLSRLGIDFIGGNEEKIGRTHRAGFKRQFILGDIEDEFRDLLRAELATPGSLSARLQERSKKVAQQVASVLEITRKTNRGLLNKETLALLDVGCGDGMASAELIADLASCQEFENKRIEPVVLLDVTDYRTTNVKDADNLFIELPPDYQQFVLGQRAPGRNLQNQRFDVILLLTVLHHSQVPSSVFRACTEVASDNAIIVVIESCVGIIRSDGSECMLNKMFEGEEESIARSEFSALGKDEQLRYAAFVDWFYNRVIQKRNDVYVPCNFGMPDEWNNLFREFVGIDVLSTYYEGFDQPLVPEFHTIHVLKTSFL